jgi:hypothetical protein
MRSGGGLGTVVADNNLAIGRVPPQFHLLDQMLDKGPDSKESLSKPGITIPEMIHLE